MLHVYVTTYVSYTYKYCSITLSTYLILCRQRWQLAAHENEPQNEGLCDIPEWVVHGAKICDADARCDDDDDDVILI